jgi:radical SAM superfamily enzyme YgiQ (UPF0313 family)
MYVRRPGIVIRPPSEAGSFLLQVTYGCSHNHCAFCGTYMFTRFARRPLDEILAEITATARYNQGVRRAFLCDGDAMCLDTAELVPILDCLNESFPRLERVGIYANAANILSKTPAELESLSARKLTIGYLGLESGNDEILKRMRKGSNSDEMVEAVRRAQGAGIDISVIVLLGLGAYEMSREHARDSASVASRMNPRYLSALTLMLIPKTALNARYKKGEFEVMDARSILQELRWFLQDVDVPGPCVFRTNHASNYLPVAGDLPQDKERMLEIIDRGLADSSMWRPESRRAL